MIAELNVQPLRLQVVLKTQGLVPPIVWETKGGTGELEVGAHRDAGVVGRAGDHGSAATTGKDDAAVDASLPSLFACANYLWGHRNCDVRSFDPKTYKSLYPLGLPRSEDRVWCYWSVEEVGGDAADDQVARVDIAIFVDNHIFFCIPGWVLRGRNHNWADPSWHHGCVDQSFQEQT